MNSVCNKGFHRLSVMICAAFAIAAAGCGDDIDTGEDIVEAGDNGGIEDVQADVSGDTTGTDIGTEWLSLEKQTGAALAGEWIDQWGTAHEITSSEWTQDFEGTVTRFEILQYENGTGESRTGFAIAKNDGANAFSPDLYSRFDWTWSADGWYFCNTAWDSESEAAALAVTPADPTTPDVSGCGGFGWTRLTAAEHITIIGAWTDTWGTEHSITDATWVQTFDGTDSIFHIDSYDNAAGVAIALNDSDNAFGGDLWSRFDWKTDVDGTWFCNSVYDAATREDAAAAPAPDSSDPANGGCGGFAWTPLKTRAFIMDEVVAAPGATDEGNGDPEMAVNGIHGGGASTGGTDVYSLKISTESYLVLRLADRAIGNGPGDDFKVFENAFTYGDNGMYMDPVIVQVSRDGMTWVSFPFDYLADDETAWSNNPADWSGFAGISPVLLNQDTDPEADPFDDVAAGGDGFDLDDLPDDDPDAAAIKAFGFTFVRLISAAAVLNPDTGAPFVHDPISNGPDIDGLAVRHVHPE